MSDELVYKFASDTEFRDFTADSFNNWRKNLEDGKNPNLLLATDFVFNILHPIFLFRAGVRQCNDDTSAAALYYASSLFFGFNHPKYRELITRDLFMLVTLPKHGSGLAKRFGFRMKDSSSGQGPDFLVEERNKAQKNWMFSHGTPTQAQWKRAGSTLSFFEDVTPLI